MASRLIEGSPITRMFASPRTPHLPRRGIDHTLAGGKTRAWPVERSDSSPSRKASVGIDVR